jgi:hypothetical protein
MKRLPGVISFFVLLLSIASFGQSTESKKSEDVNVARELDKAFNTKVDMDVDTTIFDSRQGNIYLSEKHKAMIMTMVAPQSIGKAEEIFNKEKAKKNYTITEKKKLSNNGRTILFQRGETEKDGQKAFMYIYQIEATPESTILISGMHMDPAEDRESIFQAIQRAAFSAKVVAAD